MKKLLLLASILIAFSAQGIAQDVAEIQQTLITKRTATWCPFCGDWGWDFFEDLLSDNSQKAVLITAHISGSKLASPTSEAFASNLGGSGTPKFIINNAISPVTSSTTATYRPLIKNEVDDNYLQAPVANTAIEILNVDDTLSIAARIRFFQSTTGEYYTGMYFVEDKVLETQASQSGVVEHHMVLRESLYEDTFGDFMISGNVAAGELFTPYLTVPLPEAYVLENLYIMGIVWRKEGLTYHVENVMLEKVPQEIFVSTQDLEQQRPQLQISPNPVAETALVQVDLPEATQATLSLTDLYGREVRTLFQGKMEAGTQTFQVNRAELGLAPGLYVVQMTTAQSKTSQRIVFSN